MRKILFTFIAFEQYNQWQKEDKQIFSKIKNLIKETVKSPFEGSGKPEALKYEYSGCWSRRINQVHRLIYKVSDVYIEIISCRYHYK